MRFNLSGAVRCAVGLSAAMLASPTVSQAQEAYASECCDVTGCCDSIGTGCCDSVCDLGCGGGVGYAFGSRLAPGGAWFSADYILWQLDGDYVPPLVTSSPAGTPLADAGVLGVPGTSILAGNDRINDDWRSGFRLRGGVWLDCCQTIGIAGDYFNTGNDSYDYSRSPDPNTIVARPFFNTQTGEPDAELVSVPNELAGTVTVRGSDNLEGAGIAFQHNLLRCCDPCGCGPYSSLDLLAGYRYYQLDSSLSINEQLTVLPGTSQPLVPGTMISMHDQFDTRNEFHGGEIGLAARRGCSWWWVDGSAKLAIGSNRRTVTVSGQTIENVPGGGIATGSGGLLTSSDTNIGRYTDNSTVVIPEFRLGVGAQLTCNIGVHAGYNVILWGDVARAASHLPPGLRVDPRNLAFDPAAGGPDPAFPGITGSDLVAHGFDFGIDFTY